MFIVKCLIISSNRDVSLASASAIKMLWQLYMWINSPLRFKLFHDIQEIIVDMWLIAKL